MHPSGEYLYVVNSNFDSRYSPDYGGTVAVVNTDTLEIQPEQTAFIPSFGAEVELNAAATRAYVTARRGDTLVALDVSATEEGGAGAALTCPDDEGNASSDPTNCIIRRVPDTNDGVRVPADPFGVEVATVTRRNELDEEVAVDVVAMSHLASQDVSAVTIPEGRGGREAATIVAAPVINRSNTIERRPGTLEMYAAGRNSDRITVWSPYVNEMGRAEAIIVRRSVILNNVYDSVEARGVGFDEDGDTLYVATRRPDALHIFDIRPADAATGDGLVHELREVVPLGDEPSDLVFHRTAQGDPLIFVPCYNDRSIHVIDPQAGVVVREIELDESPYALVTEGGTFGHCEQPGQPCRGYVSLFADASLVSTSCDDSDEGCGSVAVIELDPTSERYLRVIAKIR